MFLAKAADRRVIDRPRFGEPTEVESHLQSFFELMAGSLAADESVQHDSAQDARMNGRSSGTFVFVLGFPIGPIQLFEYFDQASHRVLLR